MDRRFMFMKKCPQGVVCPCPGAIIHVYDHTIQISSSLQPLGQSKPNFMWNIISKGE